MKMYGGVFLYSNPLGSYEQSKFSRLVAKLKIAHNFPMGLNKEKPHRTSSCHNVDLLLFIVVCQVDYIYVMSVM